MGLPASGDALARAKAFRLKGAPQGVPVQSLGPAKGALLGQPQEAA